MLSALATWTVVHCPPSLSPGDRASILGTFATETQAVAFLNVIQLEDPVGLAAGHYGIDGPPDDLEW